MDTHVSTDNLLHTILEVTHIGLGDGAANGQVAVVATADTSLDEELAIAIDTYKIITAK